MITPQNWVERDPTLKDMAKILKSKEGMASQINYGLMGYPVLMTADILTFNADLVPVIMLLGPEAAAIIYSPPFNLVKRIQM
jgi:tryptophanyl-tRNA synthetase